MLPLALVLLIATGLAHSYLGERYLLMRLFKRQDLPKLLGSTAFTIGTLRFVWHLTTVAWWGLAYLVFIAWSGTVGKDQVLAVVGVTSLVSAAFPLYFTRGRHLSWIVFLLIGVLVLASRSSL
ncbi:MAG: hypothetical protein IV097_11345 [Burkholderiaceae bacterium]|nr:hypothetical protein [Burkholderiaceae bacterium]